MGHGDQRKYLVIDLETTGLEEDEGDEILELAAIAVNADLTEHARFERIVQPLDLLGAIARMKPFVQKMHTDNGLLAALKSGQGSDVQHVEEALVGFIHRCDFSPGDIILAGNSVHFDRRFLDKYMSKFTWLCSHRLCDVSGTHRFLRDLCGLSFEDENRNKAHRAMDDALESLELAQRMRSFQVSVQPAFKEWGSSASDRRSRASGTLGFAEAREPDPVRNQQRRAIHGEDARLLNKS